MNKALLIVAASLMASQVFAATQTSAAVPLTTAVKPSESTTLSAPAEAVLPSKNPFKLNYAAETTIGGADANKSNWDGGIQSLQHVGLKYSLNADQAIQFRQYFAYNFADKNRTDEWSLYSSMLRFTDNKELQIGGVTVAGDTRFYIPGADLDRRVGQYTLRHDATVEQKFGKATLSYTLSARGYAYAEESAGQVGFRALPAIGLEYAVNSVVTPYITAFTDHRWMNTGRGVVLAPTASQGSLRNPANNSDKFSTDLGARFAISKNVSIDAFIETTKDLRSQKNYNPLEDNNNTYEIDLSVSM